VGVLSKNKIKIGAKLKKRKFTEAPCIMSSNFSIEVIVICNPL